MRVMYQQVAIDHFNNGDGSCRGGTFLSGALVLEDDADKKLFNTLMEVGTYRRASSHEVRMMGLNADFPLITSGMLHCHLLKNAAIQFSRFDDPLLYCLLFRCPVARAQR